jgi:hypothetical protein
MSVRRLQFTVKILHGIAVKQLTYSFKTLHLWGEDGHVITYSEEYVDTKGLKWTTLLILVHILSHCSCQYTKCIVTV